MLKYQRVCPTRIRCACATFACNLEGMDIGFFAKNFMKNKEETTQRHYNLHSNVKHALSLAMMVGDGFQVGGERITIKQSDREDLTNLLLKKSRPSELPSKEKVLEWIKLRNSDLTAMEMNAIDQILEELSLQKKQRVRSMAIVLKMKMMAMLRMAVELVMMKLGRSEISVHLHLVIKAVNLYVENKLKLLKVQ